jgi:membrane-bound lytic murein transglycosylase A
MGERHEVKRQRSTNPRWCGKTMWKALIFFCFSLTILAACTLIFKPTPITRETALVRIDPRECPAFIDDMDLASARQGALQSLEYLKRLSPSVSFQFGPDTFSVAHVAKSLETFLNILDSAPTPIKLRKRIKESFWVYRSIGADGQGKILFTGYYEPVMKGSLVRTDVYRYPIYRRPDDWTRIDLGLFDSNLSGRYIIGRHQRHNVVPYYTRREIDTAGHLANQGCELVWVRDPIGLFFLHIQGSGEVVLEDESVLEVHYSCSNGHSYRSIGRLLIDEDKIPPEEMSMQRIMTYLQSHPEDVERVLSHNQSYIFFEIVDEGPLGCLDVPLTPGRSIATDNKLFPKGSLAFIHTEKPIIAEDGTIRTWIDCSRFVFNQDTGGAIKGPGRVDLFCGKGQYAELVAGHMKQYGTLYFLVLKGGARGPLP